MKTCSKCGETKPTTDFYAKTRRCKPCHIAASAENRKVNGERIRARAKARYRENAEAAKARARRHYRADIEASRAKTRERSLRDPKAPARKRKWAAENREKTAASVAAYNKRNPLRAREATRRRRARIKAATVEPVDYAEILEAHGRVCHLCELPIVGEIDFDHVIPLSRGGAHSAENVRPAHPRCNRRKQAKTPDEYRQAADIRAA